MSEAALSSLSPAPLINSSSSSWVITACAVLHNICLGVGDIMPLEDELKDAMPEDEEVENGLEGVSGAPWRDRLSAEVSALEEARLNEALARVESLEQEKKNAMAREKSAKTTGKKNLINEELEERLEFYSDMGDGNSKTDVATEALVFMVVAIQGHWKAPIAYYLMNSLSPETQRFLLSHALEELHARGIRVAYSPIATTTGQINWRYINYLNDVQKKDGLHAANKITDKNFYFENHKMRVSLAAQTLSRSVSVGLRTMKDLGYSQFKDSEATAEFIEVLVCHRFYHQHRHVNSDDS
ncbi:hypothetical protein DPX16_18177 [Scomber scombrus]|uniref:DDE Tnp4 domain-containing protein n=1 Tax=Scomber scombrus TaxID=13677 RepID=A0AAV1QEL5_SCOSC